MNATRLFLVGALLSVVALAQAVSLEGTLGFSGFVKPDRWTPVFVALENLPRADKQNSQPRNIDGSLVLVGSGHAQTGFGVTRPVQLPANDRKRVTMYAHFPAGGGKYDLLLTDKSGRVLEPSVVEPRLEVDPAARLAVTIQTAEVRMAFTRLRDLPPIHNAQLPPDSLPDQWYGYDSADLVIVPRVTDALFSEDTARALTQWVAQGGTLLLVGGRHASTFVGSPLDALMPCDVDGTEPYLLADRALVRVEDPQTTTSGGLPITQVTPRDGARVLLRMGEVPLLVERAHGSGSVMFATCDWNPEILAASDLDLLVGTTILSAPGMASVRDGFIRGVSSDTGGILGLGNAAKLPSNRAILGILATYFVIVGPANFFILHRRKRLELAWITVPVIVALFSGGIYAYSYLLKGRDTVFRTFHVLTGSAGSDTVRSDSLSLLFVQQTGAYSINCPQNGVAMLPFGSAWEPSFSSSITQGRTMVSQPTAGGMALPGKRVAQWSMDFTRLSAVASLGGMVDCELTADGPVVTGWLANRTAKPLHSPVLFVGDVGANLVLVGQSASASEGVAAVHTVAPGERIEFTLDPSIPVVRDSWTPMNPYERYARNKPPPVVPLPPSHLMAQQLVSALVGFHGAPDPDCVLMFATDTVPVEPAVDAPVSAPGTGTGVALRVPLKGSGSGLPRRVLGEWVAVDGKAPVGNQYGSYAYAYGNQAFRTDLYRQNAIAALRVPVDGSDTLPTTGCVELSVRQGTAGRPKVDLAVYDFSAHRWTDLDATLIEPPSTANQPTTGMRGQQEVGYALEFDLTGVQHVVHPVTGAVWIRAGYDPGSQSTTPLGVFVPQLMGADQRPPHSFSGSSLQ